MFCAQVLGPECAVIACAVTPLTTTGVRAQSTVMPLSMSAVQPAWSIIPSPSSPQ